MAILLAAVVLLALFSGLAFWRPYAPLFMILAGMAMMFGLRVYDLYTTVTGMAFSLVLISYSFLCIGYTFKVIFWQPGEE